MEVEIKEVSKEIVNTLKKTYRIWEGQDNVKLRLPFVLRKVSTLRQLSSQKKVTLLVSRTNQWAVNKEI